ncbi:HaaA family cyclophane-containing RiPP peptide [Streptomyces sp. NPDC001093]|uniref:HaaA family cyclophane-containing RiPP peptide n=1 Tax=Streptomyces sp. NPDC001093 TaxID=3154376 RepID=UPI0033217B61
MPPPTFVTEPHTITPAGRTCVEPVTGATAVLDRVAARVRQRLVAEQAPTNRVGDGAHAASLIWPWPL